MKLIKLGLVFSLSFFLFETAFAAGSTVNEDFALVRSLCDDMIGLAKNGNTDGFMELADATLKLSEAQRRNNSMSIDRFRPKIRMAKKAAKQGEFNKAISLLEEAKPLMKPATAAWDGGA
jgi:hypothetical protein